VFVYSDYDFWKKSEENGRDIIRKKMLIDNEEKRLMNYIVDSGVCINEIRNTNYYYKDMWDLSFQSLKAKSDLIFQKKFL
jgi:hypothetical protein